MAYALPKNIAALKEDLGKYRIQYDVWFPESSLHQSGAVEQVVRQLLEKGACYQAEDGAIMYRSAQYAAKYGAANKKKTDDGAPEQDKDEVLVRANGIPTYFAADIAYHYNKLATRGFDKAIDVWGADHHGHVARMKGAMDAIGLDGSRLDVVLMQMVNLMQDGQPVRMSKRTGNAITLTDLLEEVPIDSARFLFNMHEAGSSIDFDLDQAVKTDNDNPVYYVQYAHARICSILRKLESTGRPGRDGPDPDAGRLPAGDRPRGRQVRPQPDQPLRHRPGQRLPPLLRQLPHPGGRAGPAPGPHRPVHRRAQRTAQRADHVQDHRPRQDVSPFAPGPGRGFFARRRSQIIQRV